MKICLLILSLFVTVALYAKTFQVKDITSRQCKFKIHTGIRSEHYIDLADTNKGTYFRYELFPIEGLSSSSDFPFLALPVKKNGKAEVESPSLVISSENTGTDKKLKPLMDFNMVKSAHISQEKTGDFQVFEVPEGSLFEYFGMELKEESRLKISIFSKGTSFCEVTVPLIMGEEH